jgi:hypothetical protein
MCVSCTGRWGGRGGDWNAYLCGMLQQGKDTGKREAIGCKRCVPLQLPAPDDVRGWGLGQALGGYRRVGRRRKLSRHHGGQSTGHADHGHGGAGHGVLHACPTVLQIVLCGCVEEDIGGRRRGCVWKGGKESQMRGMWTRLKCLKWGGARRCSLWHCKRNTHHCRCSLQWTLTPQSPEGPSPSGARAGRRSPSETPSACTPRWPSPL